jgi:6-pyruvoyltetrahydropterin/6-carboxytetrahydropterin synthase
MLLPTTNPLISVDAGSGTIEVRYQNRQWAFPRGDCILLPIENTTAELLARYIAQRLAYDLRRRHDHIPDILRVEVEESVGQSATYEITADNSIPTPHQAVSS